MHLEIPLDSIQSAIAAQAGGATRVELCADLQSGGITPSAGMIALARKVLTIKLHVMIRPRGGNFCYSSEEFEVMKRDIVAAKEFDADGVVFGILTGSNNVDIERTKELVALAKPLSVTFHRAFDPTAEPFKAMEEIINLGIERILTSGQKQTAMEGLPLIKGLVKASKERIIIMPASGINAKNVQTILNETGVSELHSGTSVADTIEYPEEGLFNARRQIVNEHKVRQLVETIRRR
ncbi:MAG: copper homeostasis protein CutC [Bacteroidetes bacterium]|nr:MAG: copper homeostasis protein CutC [Bacteroidota bacterium]